MLRTQSLQQFIAYDYKPFKPSNKVKGKDMDNFGLIKRWIGLKKWYLYSNINIKATAQARCFW